MKPNNRRKTEPCNRRRMQLHTLWKTDDATCMLMPKQSESALIILMSVSLRLAALWERTTSAAPPAATLMRARRASLRLANPRKWLNRASTAPPATTHLDLHDRVLAVRHVPWLELQIAALATVVRHLRAVQLTGGTAWLRAPGRGDTYQEAQALPFGNRPAW
eukprot:363896-Chlamydomonas_euryale.AAC.9